LIIFKIEELRDLLDVLYVVHQMNQYISFSPRKPEHIYKEIRERVVFPSS